MSRPEKPIDWKKVDDLLIAGCLGTEIAAHFDMHATTFYSRVEEKYGMSFTLYSSEKKHKGDSLLRAKQFEKALEKDNTMLIWLGKQRLSQRENNTDAAFNDSQLKQIGEFFSKLSQSDCKAESTSVPKA